MNENCHLNLKYLLDFVFCFISNKNMFNLYRLCRRKEAGPSYFTFFVSSISVWVNGVEYKKNRVAVKKFI